MLTGKLPHFIQKTQIQWARFGSSAVENAAPNTYKGNNLEYPNLGTTAGKLEEQKYEETFKKCALKQDRSYPYGAEKTSATAENESTSFSMRCSLLLILPQSCASRSHTISSGVQ